MIALHQDTPADRAMTPDAVASEIMNGVKDRAWVLLAVPRDCRVPVRTRPPLFWESKVRQWWTGRKAS